MYRRIVLFSIYTIFELSHTVATVQYKQYKQAVSDHSTISFSKTPVTLSLIVGLQYEASAGGDCDAAR